MARLQLLLHLSACFLFSLFSLAAPDNNGTTTAVDLPPPRFSFSFNFSNESSNQAEDLQFEGSAAVHGKLVDLTCNSYNQNINGCAGRMSYGHAVPFYDNATGELASFSTRFTFAILLDETQNNKGDGMTFFLSSYPSSMPLNSGGGNLGLLNGTTAYGAARFIAVEFDTYPNTWDPKSTFDHIGIDISSVQSANVTSLPSFTLNGTMMATIRFHNTTGELVASLQFSDDPSAEPYEVSTCLPQPVSSLLPQEVAVGFSATTGSSVELHQIMAWSFNSTLAPATLKGHDKKAVIVGGALVLVLVLLVLVVWFAASCWKWRTRYHAFDEQGIRGPRRFEYQDLADATDHFSDELKIGQGAFGVVYKGFLKKLGREVAVKKILNESSGPKRNKDFFAELNTISEAKHKNLIKIVGWCRGNKWNIVDFMCWCKQSNNNKLFLVYELVPNGNLDDHLHKKEDVLPWPLRYKIVKDIACALLYLHDQCRPCILHRDIKPSNILLDNAYNAMLADFGLSRIANQGDLMVMTTAIGTENYLDPQCKKSGMVAFKPSSDIYSFGIVLLEISCRAGVAREQVWQLYINNSLLEAADDKLNGEFVRSEMEHVIVLGLWCSFLDVTKRPKIQQVMDVLEHGTPLPDLNLLDTTSVSTQLETYIDLQAPRSAGSSSYELQA